MTVTEPELSYPRATFTKPLPYGYVYIGFRVDPPGRFPFVRGSAKRRGVISDCKRVARQLANLSDVISATVYEAVVIPPVAGSPRFDVLVLIETTSPASAATVQAAEEFLPLAPDFVMVARNIRRIGDGNRTKSAAFLFNHFTSADPAGALRIWEDITSWFTHKAGVTDAVLLQPTGDAPYVFVNHVPLPCGPVRFLLRFAKPSFRRVVTSRLTANRIGNAPVFCKPV